MQTPQRQLRTEVEQQLRLCPTLPTLSSVALRLIELGRNPDIDLRDVAELLSNDPALAAKTLRIANSPLYMRGRRARNLVQAVTVLGLHATVTLALSFSLAASLRNRRKTRIDLDRYWRRALLSALAARLLGTFHGLHGKEELFLAGLLQDLGMLALDAAMPESYAALEIATINHEALAAHERAHLGIDHSEAGAWLMQEWGLPEYLVTATQQSHNLDPADTSDEMAIFVGCAAVSGRMAEIYLAADTDGATATAAQAARSCLDMSPDDLAEVMERMTEALPEMESLFDITVLAPPQARGLTDQARELMTARNLKLLESASDVQQREREFQQQADRLDQMARQDVLTGLFNRRHFDEAFAEKFAHTVTNRGALSLAYLDLDHFKAVNDKYGHAAGDAILSRVANEIQLQLRKDDLFARYGGEEFVLLMPGIGAMEARKIVDRIRVAIENIEHELNCGKTLSITVSAGIASYTAEDQDRKNPQALMEVADHALYKAKHQGRNCVVSAS